MIRSSGLGWTDGLGSKRSRGNTEGGLGPGKASRACGSAHSEWQNTVRRPRRSTRGSAGANVGRHGTVRHREGEGEAGESSSSCNPGRGRISNRKHQIVSEDQYLPLQC